MAESTLSVREALKLLHPNAADRIKATRWYVFAQIIDNALYNGAIEEGLITMSTPAGINILGVDGNKIDIRKAMRDLAHECERMALLEATK